MLMAPVHVPCDTKGLPAKKNGMKNLQVNGMLPIVFTKTILQGINMILL